MKKLIHILIFSILVFACRENEIFFEGPYFVRFTEESGSELESYTDIIPLSVHLVAPQVDERITINYSISGTAVEGKDFEILGNRGTVVIPRNDSFGFIDLKLINNSNNILETQEIVFTITSVSPSNYEIGYGSGVRIGNKMTFTIVDDCILGGTYSAISDVSSTTYDGIRISSSDCITYRVSNWDINIFEYPTTRDLLFTDNGDNTLNIPQQEEDTLPVELATITGDGFVNPETREVTLNIQLIDFTDSPIISVKYTPQ